DGLVAEVLDRARQLGRHQVRPLPDPDAVHVVHHDQPQLRAGRAHSRLLVPGMSAANGRPRPVADPRSAHRAPGPRWTGSASPTPTGPQPTCSTPSLATTALTRGTAF